MSKVDKSNGTKRPALLPAGFKDQLPLSAAHESSIVHSIIARCESSGYERVKPPLIEFEDSLLFGPGESMMDSTFRLMDPLSGRMMGIRADMTVQVARIASTRLRHIERPLRLCYSGEVLRVQPASLTPERELVQVGAELVGPDNVVADLEVILLAFDALHQVGAKNMSIDISTPTLVPIVLQSMNIDMINVPNLRSALDRKDITEVEKLGGVASGLLVNLMEAAGSWEVGMKKLRKLTLPVEAIKIIERLETAASLIFSKTQMLEVTIDPVENRGFEYYNGLGFSFFSRGVRGELGRGGRYYLEGETAESSCGFTLYMETLLRALEDPKKKDKLFVPVSVNGKVLAELQKGGWSTVSGLEIIVDEHAEAGRLGCSHFFKNGTIKTV